MCPKLHFSSTADFEEPGQISVMRLALTAMVNQVIQAYDSVSNHRNYILFVSCCLNSWYGIYIVSKNVVWPYKVFEGLCALLAKFSESVFHSGELKMKPEAQSLLQCISIQ